MQLGDFSPSASLHVIEQRAALLRKLREFFHARSFVEVETPLVADEIIPELHIEPIRTDDGLFLQASPELHMKRLLAAGAHAIFQVTRSFRAGERGQLHNPEFTIVEWYRPGDDMAAGMSSDRKSTRLNSSHLGISYAVFCLKKKIQNPRAAARRTERTRRTRS